MNKTTRLIGMDLLKTGTHFDMVISEITDIDNSRGRIQGGLWNSFGGVYVGIIRHGGFVFEKAWPIDKEYFSEKLQLSRVDVDEIFDLLGVKEGEDTYGEFLNW